jgi:hypothetical protein
MSAGFSDLGLGEQHDDWSVERPAKRAKLCLNQSDMLLDYPTHDYQNYSWSNSEFQGSAVNHQSLLVEDEHYSKPSLMRYTVGTIIAMVRYFA